MTFNEFNKINNKYNFSMFFNEKLESMSKEKYEELVKSAIEVIEDIFNDDSNEEDDI